MRRTVASIGALIVLIGYLSQYGLGQTREFGWRRMLSPATPIRRDFRPSTSGSPSIQALTQEGVVDVFRVLAHLARYEANRLQLRDTQREALVRALALHHLRQHQFEIDWTIRYEQAIPGPEQQSLMYELSSFARDSNLQKSADILGILTSEQELMIADRLKSLALFGPCPTMGLNWPIHRHDVLVDRIRHTYREMAGPTAQSSEWLAQLEPVVSEIKSHRARWRAQWLKECDQFLDELMGHLDASVRTALMSKLSLSEFQRSWEPRGDADDAMDPANLEMMEGQQEFFVSSATIPYLIDGSIHWGAVVYQCCIHPANDLELTQAQRYSLLWLLNAEHHRMIVQIEQIRSDLPWPRFGHYLQLNRLSDRAEVEERMLALARNSSNTVLEQCQNVMEPEQFAKLRCFAGEALLWANVDQLAIVLDREQLNIAEEDWQRVVRLFVEAKERLTVEQDRFATRAWKVVLQAMPNGVQQRFLNETGFALFEH